MAEFAHERLDIGGIETAVLTSGTGRPLLFLHDAETIAGFDPLLELADAFQVVAPHRPGYGDSADDPRIDSIQDHVLHSIAVLDELGIDDGVAVVGHGLGGLVAAWLAIEQPARVERLALIAPLGLRVDGEPAADLFVLGPDLPAHLTADPAILDGRVPAPPTPEYVLARYREATATARVLWSAPNDLRLPRWLHRATMPTLLLWGEDDRIAPASHAAAWDQLLPDSTVELVPGAGHLVLHESPQALSALRSFAAADVATGS